MVQLTFLKLFSATARQNFTYLCQNSVGWFDSATGSHRQALRFRGMNEEELAQEKMPFIKAPHDGCQVRMETMQYHVKMNVGAAFKVV